MALRSLRALALLLALAFAALCCLAAAQGNANDGDCCLHVRPQPPPFSRKLQNQLTSYRFQGPQMGCRREAIVFITRKGRELCISPDADWAPGLMRKIDARNQKPARGRQGV